MSDHDTIRRALRAVAAAQQQSAASQELARRAVEAHREANELLREWRAYIDELRADNARLRRYCEMLLAVVDRYAPISAIPDEVDQLREEIGRRGQA